MSRASLEGGGSPLIESQRGFQGADQPETTKEKKTSTVSDQVFVDEPCVGVNEDPPPRLRDQIANGFKSFRKGASSVATASVNAVVRGACAAGGGVGRLGGAILSGAVFLVRGAGHGMANIGNGMARAWNRVFGDRPPEPLGAMVQVNPAGLKTGDRIYGAMDDNTAVELEVFSCITGHDGSYQLLVIDPNSDNQTPFKLALDRALVEVPSGERSPGNPVSMTLAEAIAHSDQTKKTLEVTPEMLLQAIAENARAEKNNADASYSDADLIKGFEALPTISGTENLHESDDGTPKVVFIRFEGKIHPAVVSRTIGDDHVGVCLVRLDASGNFERYVTKDKVPWVKTQDGTVHTIKLVNVRHAEVV